MYALVEDNNITKLINNPKSLVIGDVNYPAKIFSVWSMSELNAIGIYEVITDSSNRKDENWYINTNESYAFADNQVTRSWGTATPKLLEDRNETNEDGSPMLDADGKQVVTKGLKSQKKEIIKNQASGLLNETDWYNHKALDDETFTIPENIKTYRANVRARSNEMETAIDNASDVDALATLYAYVNTGTEENPVYERPLGEFPTLEV